MRTIFPFITVLIACSALLAEETNTVYVTDSGQAISGIYLESEHGRWINPQKIEEAKKIRECQPAKDFPEGNWSELADGIQISLRFDKRTYTNREPIIATVLVRNVSNKSIFFRYSNKVTYGAIDYLAYTESNQFAASKPKYRGLVNSSGAWINIGIGIQRKFVDRLNETYDLPKGHYFIQASITASPIGATNFNGYFPIKSIKVPIEIK